MFLPLHRLSLVTSHRGRRSPNAAAVAATLYTAVAATGFIGIGGLMAGGCGGSNSSSSSNSSTTPITVSIDWAAQSRNINAPSSAQSCIISLQSGNPSTSGGSIDFAVINRDTTKPSGYTQVWTSPSSVRTGSNKVNVRFYSQADGKGDTVADLTQAVTIQSDGSGVGPFTLQSRVAKIAIADGQTVNFGNTGVIGFAAFDATNKQIVSVAQQSAFFTTSGNVPQISPSGTMTGNLLGHTQVTASVDGITSPAVQVASIVGTNALTTTASGLRYRETIAGSGTPVTAGQAVTVTYRLYLSTDNNLDSGNYQQVDPGDGSEGTLSFVLGTGRAVPGFDEGVTGMKPGATRLLVVPPALGYADTSYNTIPANSTLIFIVHLPATTGN